MYDVRNAVCAKDCEVSFRWRWFCDNWPPPGSDSLKAIMCLWNLRMGRGYKQRGSRLIPSFEIIQRQKTRGWC